MSTPDNQAVYRIRKSYRKENRPKKYKNTYTVTNDRTETTLATCDLIGQAVFNTQAILDHEQKAWQMKPNRRIMPSRWIVTAPHQRVAMQFDQKILGKMMNPLYKTMLALLDDQGREVYHLVDPRKSIPDRIMIATPGEWALLHGKRPMAKVVRLPRNEEPAKGLFGKLKKFLSGSDQGLVSAEQTHTLSAPVALAMLLLVKELSDVSAQ